MELEFYDADPPAIPPPPPASPETMGWLREHVNALDVQIKALATRRMVLVELIGSDNAEAREVAGNPAAPEAAAKPTPLISMVPPDADLTGLVIDLEGTQNTFERIVRIAEGAPDKLLNVTQVARYIIGAGHSQATVQNQRVAVQRTIDGHSDLFERVRQATYRYCGDEPKQAVLSVDAPETEIPEEPENE